MYVARTWLATVVLVTMVAICLSGRVAVAAAAETVPRAAAAEPLRLLDVPYVPQSEQLCGGAALAMVLRYWGEPAVLAEDFASLVEPGAAGIRADDLVAAVRSRGWTAMPMNGTPDGIRAQLALGRPVIAFLRVRPGVHHFVVLVAWANGGVILHDPATAPFRIEGESAFAEAWAEGGHWALVILPPPRILGAPLADSTGPERESKTPLSGCDAIVDAAIASERNGDVAVAERGLLSAYALCPESASPPRALAGMRFKAKDWSEAARFAERALFLDPDDSTTWRLLAGSRFLLGNEEGALRAWNEISEPRADLARVDGLARTRYRAVASQLGLPPGRMLTSRAFARAGRRLAEMPAQERGRLSLRPLPRGAAQVNVALLERPLLFDGPIAAGGTVLRAVVEHETSIRVASPTGNGELWTAAFRWKRERPSVSLALAVPAPGGRPGVWRVEGLAERQAYEADTSRVREERRRSALSFADWIGADLRLEVGAALDKWSGHGAHVGLEGAFESRLAGDRLSFHARIARWASLDHGAPFGTGSLRARWNSSDADRGGWLVDAGASRASANAPLALWPGAGTGTGRAHLLRAHPLLSNDVITGDAFGRTLLHATLEGRSWIWRLQPLRLGGSLFVDTAKPWEPLRSANIPWRTDVGVGLRIAGLGARSEFRVAVARGLQDGATAVSAGWEVR